MAKKVLWRNRKRSLGDPVKTLGCGCKVWAYDGTVLRHCEKHKVLPEGLR